MVTPTELGQSKLIENVHKRATKTVSFIANMPYEERLNELKLPSLKYQRLWGDLIQVYKFLSEDKMSYNHIIPLKENLYNTKGHGLRLKRVRYKSSMKKCSFSSRVLNYWNNLNSQTVHANDIIFSHIVQVTNGSF